MATRSEEKGAVAPDDALFEFRRIGPSVRVAAIDPKTNTEVVIVGAAVAGDAALMRLALRKLNTVLAGRGGR